MGSTKIAKWFAVWFLLMVLIVLFTQPSSRPDKLDTLDYSTTESAELYFRNVRSFYYRKAEEGGDVFEVYRLNTLFEDTSSFIIPLALYNAWRFNQAFIRIDTARFSNTLISAILIDSTDTISRILDVPSLYNNSQFEFARSLYKALRNKQAIGIKLRSNKEVWLTIDQTKALRTTLADYFRLIGKI